MDTPRHLESAGELLGVPPMSNAHPNPAGPRRRIDAAPEFARRVHVGYARRSDEAAVPARRRGLLGAMAATFAVVGAEGCRRPLEKIVPYTQDAGGRDSRRPLALRDRASSAAVTRSGSWSSRTRGGRRRSRATSTHPSSLGGGRPHRPGQHPRALRSRALHHAAQGRRGRRAGTTSRSELGAKLAQLRQGPGRPAPRCSCRRPSRPRSFACARRSRSASPRPASTPGPPVADSNARAGAQARVRRARQHARTRFDKAQRHRLARQRLPPDRVGQRPRDASSSPPGAASARRSDSMSRLYVVEPARTTTGERGGPPPAPPGQRDRRLRLRPRGRAREERGRRWATVAAAAAKAGGRRQFPPKWLTRGREGARAQPRARASSWSARASRREVHALAHAINAALGARAGDRQLRAGRPIPTSSTSPTDLKALTDAIAARPGRGARHPRRQPGLRRAGRPRVRREAGEGALQRARVALRRRDEREVHLARAARARVRVVGRRPRRSTGPSASSSRSSRRSTADGATSRCSRWMANAPGEERARPRCARPDRRAARLPRPDRLRPLRRARRRRVQGRSGQHRARCTSSSSSASGTARSRGHRPPAAVPQVADAGARGRSPPPSTAARPRRAAPGAFEVTFAPCPKMVDGRYANNTWLQELPDVVTKLVWDNAAILSPATRQGARRREQGLREDRASATARSPRPCGSSPARPTTRSR